MENTILDESYTDFETLENQYQYILEREELEHMEEVLMLDE